MNARHENKDTRTRGQLGRMAAPKTWEMSNGSKVRCMGAARMGAAGRAMLPLLLPTPVIGDQDTAASAASAASASPPTPLPALALYAQVLVHTMSTLRAKELQQLYGGVTLAGLPLEERLDVLLHVKWTVKEFDSPLTREIVGLIEREADMLNRWAGASGKGAQAGVIRVQQWTPVGFLRAERPAGLLLWQAGSVSSRCLSVALCCAGSRLCMV